MPRYSTPMCQVFPREYSFLNTGNTAGIPEDTAGIPPRYLTKYRAVFDIQNTAVFPQYSRGIPGIPVAVSSDIPAVFPREYRAYRGILINFLLITFTNNLSGFLP